MRSGQEIAGTSPDICEKLSHKLTWAEILERCKANGPAGCTVDAAVAAHRFASERYQFGKITQNALQVVILAVANSPEEDQRKLEYLSSLARAARQAFRAVEGRAPR